MAGRLSSPTAERLFLKSVIAIWAILTAVPAFSDMTAAEKWIETEFQLSTLSRRDQLDEMAWFAGAATPFSGLTIKVISKNNPIHRYESEILAQAFYEITGIKVVHELAGEREVSKKLQSQRPSGGSRYDAWICDSESMGTLVRKNLAVPLCVFIAGDGRAVTLPTLDLSDFIGRSASVGPDGKLYQLPDQQFANLYWFRYDWFSREDLKEKFKNKYGYDLGVPINWSAYEDIADFFTNKVQKIDGRRIFGHNSLGRDTSQMARCFIDTWLSMAGVGDKGIPSGKPVGGWGIREENCHPAGASVSRGGAVNGPAAKYALRKYFEWNQKYAPSKSAGLDIEHPTELLAGGHVAQQIFFYTSDLWRIFAPGPSVNSNGTPKWRVAPPPHGPYWENGMKLGYQECSAWTLLRNTPLKRRKAAWLYAQFCVAKTVSLKKAHLGLAPIRESDIYHASFTRRASRLGGLVEFYRSPERTAWTPNGANVPACAEFFQLWEGFIGNFFVGKVIIDPGMDELACRMDDLLLKLSLSPSPGVCAVKLNEKKDNLYWLKQSGSPKAKVNEKTQGKTVDYDQLLQIWREEKGESK